METREERRGEKRGEKEREEVGWLNIQLFRD